MHSRQEQQLAFLKERVSEFKQAAMQAKKNHDLELAKQYIRMMKVKIFTSSLLSLVYLKLKKAEWFDF